MSLKKAHPGAGIQEEESTGSGSRQQKGWLMGALLCLAVDRRQRCALLRPFHEG